MNRKRLLIALCGVVVILPGLCEAAAPMKALIIDGQNNHGAWPKTTFMMKKYLEQTGLFTVDINRTQFTWRGDNLIPEYSIAGKKTKSVNKPQTDPDFRPQFSKYDVVVSNFGFGAAPWPEETRTEFEKFVRGGGGFVVIHAADNSFGNWPEYNQMIGLGGWGGRNEKHGPYVYLSDQGEVIRDKSPGNGGHHGSQHAFPIVVRDSKHPITRGMPREWLHAKDELYDKLRGPAQNMQILATAYASPKHGGTGRHEPMLMTIQYGKGRVFHTPMGHADYSQECTGFIVTLQRGTEWAATGKVSQKLPSDFPTADKESKRAYVRKK